MRIHGSNVWRGHYRVEGAFMCGEAFTCGGDITVQLPYTVINVWRGITMWEPLPCGGDITVQLLYTVINVWRGHYCVGAITVWRAITMWRGHYHAATVHSN